MGSSWYEVPALGRPATRWGSLLALLVAAACGGDRDAAPAGDEGSVATVDTATTPAPAPTATDTSGGATPPTADTTASRADTAAKATANANAKAKQPPKPTETPAPKTPAQKPAPAAPSPDTTTRLQTTTQPQESAQAAQDTPQATQETGGAPLRDAYHQAPRDTVDQATYDGWKQYNLNCARCHGEDVLGTTIAPHLVMSLKPDGPIPTQEAFVQTVCAGRPEKGMPSWCALGMDPAKINQIYSYVKGRSEGKLSPGRPARRQGG
jgi:hypothetical protein